MAMEKKQRAAAESGVLLLIVAGILVALNALSALGGFKRLDTTKTEKYTLSKGSGNLVRTLKQNMQVDAYVAKGLPKLDAFVRDLRDLLQEYKDASGGHFDYRLIEAKDEDQKKEAKEAGIQEQQMGEASATEDEKGAVTQGFMGLVFKYGAEKDVIPSLSPDHSDGLEFWITNKLREIRDKADNNKHKVGVLTGHDEIKLTESNLVPGGGGPKGKGPSVQDIVTNNFKFYEFVPVDLKNGDAAIDEALDGLIVTQPGTDLTEKELRRIDQFVMKGKSLAVVASSVNIKNADPTMNATLNAHGLDKLLDGYGIELRKDVVLDFSHAFTVLIPTESGIARLAFPQFLHITDDTRFSGNEQLLDTSFPAFFRLEELMFPFVSSLVLHKDKQPDAKTMKVVARSSPYSFHETTDTVDLKPFQHWKPKAEKPEQYNVAATIEGTLATAFPSGDKMGVDTPDKSAQPARVFVLAASQYLANPFAKAGEGQDMSKYGMQQMVGGDKELQELAQHYLSKTVLTAMILSFKDTLDWLTGDTDLLAASAKLLSEPNLTYDIGKPKFDPNETEEQLKKQLEELRNTRKRQQYWVEWILILGVPLLFGVFGVSRWRMRLAARENISLA
jgi:ABC-type uncharacterized transport system involved in gliding motility auxiliary subunit